jgi:hypothetical protein
MVSCTLLPLIMHKIFLILCDRNEVHTSTLFILADCSMLLEIGTKNFGTQSNF